MSDETIVIDLDLHNRGLGVAGIYSGDTSIGTLCSDGSVTWRSPGPSDAERDAVIAFLWSLTLSDD